MTKINQLKQNFKYFRNMNKDLISTALSDILNVAASIATDTTEARTKRQAEKQAQINKSRVTRLKKSYDILKQEFINNQI